MKKWYARLDEEFGEKLSEMPEMKQVEKVEVEVKEKESTQTRGFQHSNTACTVVNNQLSGAGKVEIDLIDFLFKPSIYLYRFNSSPIGLDT
jgi:hypothetical protein